PGSLSAEGPYATKAAGNAREVTAVGVDGHSFTAEDPANFSRGGRAH
ncbi:hypothetical protein N339_02005, partial [Pterocles gutturalis]